MMQTRKVNTYGRRSTAIVSASAGIGRSLVTPTRAQQEDHSSPDTPLSEISAGLVVVSPSLSRSKISPVLMEQSKKAPLSGSHTKKENIHVDMNMLSISSPSVTRPRKRKPLLVPSPKVRGSPRQSRLDKKMRKLPALTNTCSPPRRAPLQRTNHIVNKLPHQIREPTIEISDDESYSAPKQHPPIRSADIRTSTKRAVRAPESVSIIPSDSSGSETRITRATPSQYSSPKRPSLQPLFRQNAIIGTPPLLQRLGTGSRLSGGSVSRLSFGSLANVSSPRSTSPVALDDDLPSPVDSDDEVAFLDAAAKLESKPAPLVTMRTEPILRVPPWSPVSTSKASVVSPAFMIEPQANRPIASSSKLKSPPTSTKSLSLSSKTSIVCVELPVPKQATKPKTRSNSTEQKPNPHPPQVAQPRATKPPKSHNQSKLAKTSKSNVNAKPPKEPTLSRVKTISPSEPDATKPYSVVKLPTKSRTKSGSHPQPTSSSPYSSELRSLLEACSQPEPIDLDAFVATFSTDEVHALYPAPSMTLSSRRRWRKIGEASYSEVFGLGGVVVKVVPLRMEHDGWNGTEGPYVSEMADVEKEIAITRTMGEIQEGFIKLAKAHVALGSYPQELLKLWDAYDREFGSESIRPDSFLPSQLYVLLILPDGGPDLEHYTFAPRTSWRAAAGIFWQVTRTLARAEALVRFEHRDLHWGQILVQNVQPKTKGSKPKSHSGPMDSSEQSGVRVTLIDLGLSRMDTHTRKAWFTELEQEVFEGEGDYQFDVYRMMKAHCSSTRSTEGIWEGFRPLTNVMWLHYLAHKLLRAKGLRKPDTITSRYHTVDDVQAEIQAFSCLVEVEKVLAAAIVRAGGSGVSKAGGSFLTKAAKGVNSSGVQKLIAAQSVIHWGAERRWVYAACGSVDEGVGVLS